MQALDPHLDTLPKLLLHNAAALGVAARHAAKRSRHLADLDLGAGARRGARLLGRPCRLGLKRGEKFAIVGGNRPRLYWAMCAGQMLGAVPVPVYADAVADEMAFVLAHAEVTLAAVEDQEQVDKDHRRVGSRCPSSSRWFTTSRAG